MKLFQAISERFHALHDDHMAHAVYFSMPFLDFQSINGLVALALMAGFIIWTSRGG